MSRQRRLHSKRHRSCKTGIPVSLPAGRCGRVSRYVAVPALRRGAEQKPENGSHAFHKNLQSKSSGSSLSCFCAGQKPLKSEPPALPVVLLLHAPLSSSGRRKKADSSFLCFDALNSPACSGRRKKAGSSDKEPPPAVFDETVPPPALRASGGTCVFDRASPYTALTALSKATHE